MTAVESGLPPAAGGAPFFSIVTCTLNGAEHLASNIASVEAQDCQDFEHIFVDGFSSDATADIVGAYRARCAGTVSFHQRPARGISDAMNAGVELARGQIILHLHGDDCLASPRALSDVRGVFASSRASIVVGNCMLTGRGAATYTWPLDPLKSRLLRIFFRPMMFYFNLIPHPSAYVAKEVFQRHGGFDEAFRVVMDYDFWFRVLKYEPLALTDKVLSVYRFHSDTVSTKQMAQGLAEIDRIRVKYRRDYPFAWLSFLVLLRPLLALRRLLKRGASSNAPMGG